MWATRVSLLRGRRIVRGGPSDISTRKKRLSCYNPSCYNNNRCRRYGASLAPSSPKRPFSSSSGNSSSSNSSGGSIWNKISQRPLEYSTIPAVAAFVGLTTNWVGVEMLFYPIEYLGTTFYRSKDSPWGLFGWQGVVPTKTEIMAQRLVDIITSRLLSLHEAFDRLEPKTLAGHLAPAVVETVERNCGTYWAMALKPVLPFVLSRLVVALKGEIEDILDLNKVVLTAFVRDKEVLVDLFQKVGRVELNFLVESGLGFGFLLGLVQMAAWARLPMKWTLPVAGSLVGYATNWIAIKLLFEPAEPVHIGSLVTLQGLFESRQVEVSDEFADFMEHRVLSSPRLLDALAEDGDDGRLYAFFRRQLPYPIPSHILSAAVEAIKMVANNPGKYPDLHKYLTDALDIEDTLATRIKLLSPTEFEDLLHPVFQEDEITLISVGGVLGAITGTLQTKLGWGGPPAVARVRAFVTLAVCTLSTACVFVMKEREIMKDETPEEQKEDIPVVVVPKLVRRNSVVRLDEKKLLIPLGGSE